MTKIKLTDKPVRITKRYLQKWIDAKMEQLEIEYRVEYIQHTRLRGHEYEGGAAIFIVVMKKADGTTLNGGLCYYIFAHMSEMQRLLNSGWKLKFCPKTISGGYILNGAEILLVKA